MNDRNKMKRKLSLNKPNDITEYEYNQVSCTSVVGG